MGSLGLSLIAFACIFGATLLGMYLRVLLPAEHLSTELRDAIRLSMGVIGTMAALVLGLLIASAKGTYDAKNNQIKQLTVDVIVLDQLLAQYGAETHPFGSFCAEAPLHWLIEYGASAMWRRPLKRLSL